MDPSGINMTTSAKPLIRQWVNKVTAFSSQYGCPQWQAQNVSGPPRVFPNHGDNSLAWAAAPKGTREFIEFQYEKAVLPFEIVIYETYHAGGVRSVSARDENGEWVVIYEADKIENITACRKLHLSVKPVEGESIALKLPTEHFKTSELRIDIDQTVSNDWVEIDAVELVGYEEDSEPEDQLGSYFNKVLDSLLSGRSSFSDVTFVLEDGSRIAAQRVVLARNEYFGDLFTEHPHHQEIRLNVPSLTKELLELVMRYCYSDHFATDDIDLLVTLATRYSVTFRIPASGMRALLKCIKPLITSDNAAAIWWRAYKASDSELDCVWRKQLTELCAAAVARRFDSVASDASHFALFDREALVEFIGQIGASVAARMRRLGIKDDS